MEELLKKDSIKIDYNNMGSTINLGLSARLNCDPGSIDEIYITWRGKRHQAKINQEYFGVAFSFIDPKLIDYKIRNFNSIMIEIYTTDNKVKKEKIKLKEFINRT